MAGRKGSGADSGRYTRPELREQLKAEIMAGEKGGRAGQWSARKAQLLAAEYKRRGGGYRQSKSEPQQHLDQWTGEQWQTAKGSARARHGAETDRYLPKKAWAELSDAEKRATDRKKRSGSRAGRQFVPNTPAARSARKHATEARARVSKRGPRRTARRSRSK